MKLQPGSMISYILMAVFICCFLCAAAPATAPTVEQQKARLVEIDKQQGDLTRKIQGCEYEKDKLKDRHEAVNREQIGYAEENAKLEKEKAGIVEALKKLEPVKDEGKGKK